jgi:hypothetical protein
METKINIFQHNSLQPNYQNRSRQPHHLKEKALIGLTALGLLAIGFIGGYLARGHVDNQSSLPPATPITVPVLPTSTETSYAIASATPFPTIPPLPTPEPAPTITDTERALLDMENTWGRSRLFCTYAVDAEGALSSCDSQKLAAKRTGAPEGAIIVNGHELVIKPGTVAEVKFEIWPHNGGFTITYQGVSSDRVQDVITYTRFTRFDSEGNPIIILRDGESNPFQALGEEGVPVEGINVGHYNHDAGELIITVRDGFGGFALTPERAGALVSGIRVDRANPSPFTGGPLP